ncbi:unnamed protein product [Paramecium pentaurelia]|uniref:Protein kinase domain-containing protein n=1 Tax=Paramecium pentaurelia TaxID=43138 RepID=A0A8S1SQF3_9CILI|nr:unnamed protein product [Paramecium pentaurelia]
MFTTSTYIPQHLLFQGPNKVESGIGQNEKRKAIDHYSYAIDQEIGKGFSSRVYKGRDERTLENVAIKVIDMKKLKQSIHTQLLRNEIKALKSFNHQNILKLFDVYQTENNTYIITEFCDSGDLEKFLRKNLKIKEPEAIRILQAIVHAINEINIKGFIHRDIKPANILLSGNQPKLADFGFAIPIWQARIQQRNINVGTPLYMSPQALGQQDYSEKGDVWAVGVVYFEMLFGRTPFIAQSEAALLQNILNQQLIIPQTPLVSELSKDFIKKCLQKDDCSRFNVKDMFEHKIIQSKSFYYSFLQEDPFQDITNITQSINNSQIKKNKRSQTQNLKRNSNKDYSTLQIDLEGWNEKQYVQQEVSQRSSSQNQMQLPQQKLKHSLNTQLNNNNNNNNNNKIQQNHQLSAQFKANNEILLFYLNYCRYLFKFSLHLANSKFFQFEIRDKILLILGKCIVIKICQLSQILDKENKLDNQFQLLEYDKYKQSEQYNEFCSAISEYQIKYMKHFQNTLVQAIKNNFQIDPIIGSSCNDCLNESNTVYEIALYYLDMGLNKLLLNLNQITVLRQSDKIVNCEPKQILFIIEGLNNCKELIMMIQQCKYDFGKLQNRFSFDRIMKQKVDPINYNLSEQLSQNQF